MADKPKCFIIMPISTPEHVRARYRDGAEHFHHVLTCLTLKAVEQAGYEAIPPIAEGADLIHAEIIKHLESADLVLCDMSSLNANVFFEFGIRCALNKPICVIKDDVTDRVPFDTGILNHHNYKSALEPWDLPAETASLVKHIDASAKKCKGSNPLWKYFGARAEATPAQGKQSPDDKFSMLFAQIDDIRRQLSNRNERKFADSSANLKPHYVVKDADLDAELFRSIIQQSCPGIKIAYIRRTLDRDYSYTVGLSEDYDSELLFSAKSYILHTFGINIEYQRSVDILDF